MADGRISSGRQPEVHLGKGTFGTVYRRDNVAVKIFRSQDIMVQELIILKYLEDSMFIVKAREFDLGKMEIRMDLHDISLKDALLKYTFTFDQKESIFKDILRGVSNMHSLELVHCDIKPANILLNIRPLRATICDPGLASLTHHGRFLQTPIGFRRPLNELKSELGQRQDLYSLAVLGLEMFSGIKITAEVTPDRLREIIAEVKITPHISEILVEFTKMESDKYPTARSVLIGLYREDNVLIMPVIVMPKQIISDADDKFIRDTIKNRTEQQKIKKGKRGYYMLVERFNNREYPVVPKSEYPLYISCVIFILSAMFGRPGFSYSHVMQMSGNLWGVKDIDRVLTDLSNKEALRNILLLAE